MTFRLIILIMTRRTWNPFLLIWWGILWSWYKIRDREVYFSKPGVIKIENNGDMKITKEDPNLIQITSSIENGMSANDIVEIINKGSAWIGSKPQEWDED